MTTLLIESKTGPPAVVAEERDYISFSAIRAYLQCSLRYFFRYVAKLPEERIGASLVFGNAIHGALELHFRRLLEGDVAPSLAEMLAAYHAGWANPSAPVRFNKDEQQSSFDGLAERMLRAFLENPVAQPKGQILGVEETLREPLIPGLPDFLGRIDLIVETDDAIVITDWKTSRSRYSAEQVDEAAAQLLLYAELAGEIARDKPLRLQFGVLTKTKEVSIDTHSVDYEPALIERTKRIIARVWQAIQAEHFYPNPSALNCSGCPYRAACRRWSG